MEKCGFQRTRYGSIMTSSFPTGQIGLLMAEKDPSKASSHTSIRERFDGMMSLSSDENSEGKGFLGTTYYHPALQLG